MIVGVDGCSAGWLVVVTMANLEWEIRIFPNIQSVWDTYGAAEMILVDIPIGLSEDGDRVVIGKLVHCSAPEGRCRFFPLLVGLRCMRPIMGRRATSMKLTREYACQNSPGR